MINHDYDEAKYFEIRFMVAHLPERIENETIEQIKRDATQQLAATASDYASQFSTDFSIHVCSWEVHDSEIDHINLEPPRTYYARKAYITRD